MHAYYKHVIYPTINNDLLTKSICFSKWEGKFKFNLQGTDWDSVTRANFQSTAILEEVDGGGPDRGGGGNFEVPTIGGSIGSVNLRLVFKLYALKNWSRVVYTQSVRNVTKSVICEKLKIVRNDHMLLIRSVFI